MRLTQPKGWRIHNSFHVSLIGPYRAGIQENPDPDQVLRKVDPIEPEFTVKDIMSSIETEGNVKYLVNLRDGKYITLSISLSLDPIALAIRKTLTLTRSCVR